MAIGKMSTRELQKNARRRVIMDAARALIMDGKDRDFSMPALAEKAGVSLVTPYNLFGSKSSILMEIVREDIFERVAEIDALPDNDLPAWIGAVSRTLAGIYYSNRHFYRRMIVTLVAQESAEEQRTALELSFAIFTAPLRRLQASGLVSNALPAEILARHAAHSVSGSLQQRLMERGSEALLRNEIEMGLLVVLAGLCGDRDRSVLRERMQELAGAETAAPHTTP